MKILSWNVCALGCLIKKAAVKDLWNYIADIGLIQETKLRSMFDSIVKEIWGPSTMDNWICGEAIGALGGILVIWNRAIFNKIDHRVGIYPLFILLEEINHAQLGW